MQIANDLKKKRSRQEVIDLQEQPNNNKNALHQMKYKVCCTIVQGLLDDELHIILCCM